MIYMIYLSSDGTGCGIYCDFYCGSASLFLEFWGVVIIMDLLGTWTPERMKRREKE